MPRACCARATWRRGDYHACRFVRVPNVAEEECPTPAPRRRPAQEGRVGHVNRIKALLALHGVRDYQPLRQDRRGAFEALRAWDGAPLPPHCHREIERELAASNSYWSRSRQSRTASRPPPVPPPPRRRSPHSRRSCASAARPRRFSCARCSAEVSVTGAVSPRSRGWRRGPYSSGRLHHEQGISKAGNPIVRARPRPARPGVGSSFPDRQRDHGLVPRQGGRRRWTRQAGRHRRGPGSSRSHSGGWPRSASCPRVPGSGPRWRPAEDRAEVVWALSPPPPGRAGGCVARGGENAPPEHTDRPPPGGLACDE